MMKFFNLFINTIIVPLSISYFLWSIATLFLPKIPVIYIPSQNDNSFFSINLERVFYSQQKKKKIVQKIKVDNKQEEESFKLNWLKLKAIYKNGNGGFIIVEDKGKSIFIEKNQIYKEYKLVEIGKDSVKFFRNGRFYLLSFQQKKLPTSTKKREKETTKEEPLNYHISKKEITHYKNNVYQIWKEIGINKDREGYKITYIKKGSIFDKIGLKKGDVLISVNGRKLNNDKDAWELYKNSENYNSFEIKIKRGNSRKVLNYEVD
jgi:general secretion pathway protein C